MTTDEKVEKIEEIIKLKITGVWEPRHTDRGHFYYNTKTGHLQASVTSKLGGVLSKPHLINWAVRKGAEWLLEGGVERMKHLMREDMRDSIIVGMEKAHTDIRDTAGNIGTVAHNAAERYINQWIADGIRPKVAMVTFAIENPDPRSVASMRAIEAFFDKNPTIPIASEILVGDIRYSAGTLDFLAIVKGELTLLDFKTSNAVDEISYSAQVAAYKYFFEDMTGLKIKKTKILHLSKDYDKFTVYNVLKLPAAYRAFKQICAIYDWKYGRSAKIEKDIKRISI